MNREFTSRVLTLLRNYVERKINLSHTEERSSASAVRTYVAGGEHPKISAITAARTASLQGEMA
jgi:hypothetical protein